MAHTHHHAHEMTGRKLRTALLLTGIILIAEVAGGIVSGSLALLADAGHVVTDMLALGLAWFAAAQSGRPAGPSKTYGYHRTGILAAMANALTLLVIVVVIAIEALRRFQQPRHVDPPLMFAAAAVGIVVNLYIAYGLSKDGHENLNVRAATLHVMGDVGASVGVIAGGAIILVTGWSAVDPLISVGIAALIAYGAWNILHETIDILMESTPRDLSTTQVAGDMLKLPAVSGVHDLHVWSIAGGVHALSAHVQVSQDCALSSCDALLASVNQLLSQRYSIGHTTIQFEFTSCERHQPGGLYCSMDHSCGDCHDVDHQAIAATEQSTMVAIRQ